MRWETEERWRTLCEQAIHEQEDKKLMQIIEEINSVLEEKEQRLVKIDDGVKQRPEHEPQSEEENVRSKSA